MATGHEKYTSLLKHRDLVLFMSLCSSPVFRAAGIRVSASFTGAILNVVPELLNHVIGNEIIALKNSGIC